MAKTKNYTKEYASSFQQEIWEMIVKYKKDNPVTKDGLQQSYNKIINMCCKHMLRLEEMKKNKQKKKEEQNG